MNELISVNGTTLGRELYDPNKHGELTIPDSSMQEIQGQVAVAQRFPRNINQASLNIIEACKRKSLAESAMYSYPKGGAKVTGASIRLLEVIASSWGNIRYGITETSKTLTETKYRAFAWDLESNVLAEINFSQRHVRWSKNKGTTDISGGDPREIYEAVMSVAARRLRSCLMKVVPPYIVEEAIATCEETLRKGGQGVPLTDRIRKMVAAFKEQGVTEDMIIKKIGHDLDALNEIELVNLQKVFTSIRDGFGAVKDYFEYSDTKRQELNETYKDK